MRNVIRMHDEIIDFYSRPQIGGSMPVFVGARRGGGFFSTLARYAMPLLKMVGSRLFGVASKTVGDVIERGHPLKESLINNSLDEVSSLIGKYRKRPADINNIEGEGYGDIFTKRRRLHESPVRKKRVVTL